MDGEEQTAKQKMRVNLPYQEDIKLRGEILKNLFEKMDEGREYVSPNASSASGSDDEQQLFEIKVSLNDDHLSDIDDDFNSVNSAEYEYNDNIHINSANMAYLYNIMMFVAICCVFIGIVGLVTITIYKNKI